MMRIAGRSHGQTANLRVFESVPVIPAQRSRRVENLDRIHGERFERGKTNSGAKQIIWVRRNSQTASFVNNLANFACGFAFQVGQLRTDAEQMPIRSRHLHPWQNEEIVDRQAIQSHQTFLEQVIHSVARVVIGNRDAVQTFSLGSRNHVFRAGNTVSGKERMRVEVDVKRHGGRSRPLLPSRYTSSSTRIPASASLSLWRRSNW